MSPCLQEERLNQEGTEGQALQLQTKTICHVKRLRIWTGREEGEVNIYRAASMSQAPPHTFSRLWWDLASWAQRDCVIIPGWLTILSIPYCAARGLCVMSRRRHKLYGGVRKENREWMCFSSLSPSGVGEGQGAGPGEGSPQPKVPVEGSPKSHCSLIAIYGNLKQ